MRKILSGRVFIAGLIALVFASCSPQYSDFFPYHDDGTPKPFVALLPVQDETQKNESDFAKEFTKEIRNGLMKNGSLYILSQTDMQKKMQNVNLKELTNPSDLMPYLYFQPAHFVILLELIEQNEIPYNRGKIKPIYTASIDPQDAVVFQMKMRMRVIDIRGGEPKVIRQEVLASNHVVPKSSLKEFLALEREGLSTRNSPIQVAYKRFERDLVEKIERLTSYSKP